MLESVARMCVRGRIWVVAAWAVVLIALGGAVGGLGAAFSSSASLPASDSSEAYAMLASTGVSCSSGQSGTIVWTSTQPATGEKDAAIIEPVLERIAALPGVTSVSSPSVIAAPVVLLLVMRSAWAALLPVITGLLGVGTATFVLMLLSHVMSVPEISLSMSAMIGFGVGIDYALFIVHRTRQDLAGGQWVVEAVLPVPAAGGRAAGAADREGRA